MNTTRYEIRDNGSDFTINVADASEDLPLEVQSWLEAGEATLVAIDADGTERVVCGG
jgi:hypothetical protein